MSRGFLFAVLIATTLHSIFVEAVFSIEDVFNLGDNCATYQTDLDEMYTEALDLLVSAVQTIDDASNVLSGTYEEAWRILYTFFHDPSTADYTQIRSESLFTYTCIIAVVLFDVILAIQPPITNILRNLGY